MQVSMMHDLPTPAPSSDAPMPGSSPTKPMRHGKGLASVGHRVFPSKPFSPLDLNTVEFQAKAFQDDRAKIGATPPPSSPTLSAALTSSPVVLMRQSSGASPTKQQRVPSIAARPHVPRITSTDASQVDLSLQSGAHGHVLGLTPNFEAESELDAIPHLLFASRTVCLVIGRCKPSNIAHAYDGRSGTGVARHQDQDAPSSTQGLGAKQILRVDLPNEARHVSRVHAIVEWIPFVAPLSTVKRIGIMKPDKSTGTFVVRIVGQNGLIVDGKRRREGQVLRLTPGRSVIDFFGVKCRFEYVPTKADRQDASPTKVVATQQGVSPVKRNPAVIPKVQQHLPSSPPPTSSPPAFGSPSKSLAQPQHSDAVVDNFHDEDGEEEDERSSSPTPAHRRADELTAGPLRVPTTHTAQCDQEETAEEDEEDESEDEDFVPRDKPHTSPKLTTVLAEKDESSDSDLDAVVVDASTPARSNSNAPVRSRAQSVVAETLTESQTRMPPPSAVPAAVRNAARRSASSSPAPAASVQELQDNARRCVRQLAATYDLAGLLAGAIVFHRTATISASEAVRSVLATTPGLMRGEAGEHCVAFSPSKRKLPGAATLQKGLVVEGWPINGDERWNTIARKAWREHLEVALQSSPMFGVISRAGKDASGNPLEFWYYYDKENDPDKERAENLGVFAKPMRKALKGQKPIFWKRSGYPSHQQDEAVEPKPLVPSRDEDSLDIATEALPSPSIGVTRKRKVASQIHQTQGEADGEELKREKLRAKIARSGLWDETQPEEKEEPTWDRKGDLDYGKSRR